MCFFGKKDFNIINPIDIFSEIGYNVKGVVFKSQRKGGGRMNKNNYDDFDYNSRPNIEEYLSKEVEQYYGEDVIHQIEASSAPNVPAAKRRNRIISAMGICCAIMFLTGAAIVSGVIFTSGIPIFGGNVREQDSDLLFSDTATEVEFFSDILIDSDTSTQAENFSNTSEATTDTANENDTSTQAENFSNTSEATTDTASEIDTSNQDNTDTASEIDTSNQDDTDTASDNDTSNQYDTDTASESDISTQADLSAVVSDEMTEENNNNDTSSETRIDYFSLPEYPDEGNLSEITTDFDNNSSTNPYDNVTTGRRIRAGIGSFLMLLSLVTAFVLNRIKHNMES